MLGIRGFEKLRIPDVLLKEIRDEKSHLGAAKNDIVCDIFCDTYMFIASKYSSTLSQGFAGKQMSKWLSHALLA